jgi:N-acetyl-anhydromuramyl-L-alanine amidase AmpD
VLFAIDVASYDKHKHFGPRHGYQQRGTVPATIVVHSTEGKPGQSFVNAAHYLFASADVSAHYLIGKSGEIAQFLDPKTWQAWHAGGRQADGTWTAQEAYSNPRSIGIECLHARGEAWPAVQRDALAWLLRALVQRFTIPLAKIETHGQIALPGPYRRKLDPTDWPYPDFLAWRNALAAPAPAPTPRYYRVKVCAWWLEAPRPDAPIALGGRALLDAGTIVAVDDVTGGWGHDSGGLGFCPLAALEAL